MLQTKFKYCISYHRALSLSVLIAFIFCNGLSSAQEKPSYEPEDIAINKYVNGTLLNPGKSAQIPLVIFVMGQGLTNRDGNQGRSKNDTFLALAHELAQQNIATFRYDKRLFSMGKHGIDETQVSFDDYINDAIAVIEHFILDERFSRVLILGHGQGSLVGMVATQDRANGFISIGGAAQSIDKTIIDQIGRQAEGLQENAIKAFKELRILGYSRNYSKALEPIFRRKVQPFMRTWMKYDPQKEIKKIDVPVLILHGSVDLEVSIEEAKKLKEYTPFAKYMEIKNMNHILKEIEGDYLQNQKSYNDPSMPIVPEVVTAIATFAQEEYE